MTAQSTKTEQQQPQRTSDTHRRFFSRRLLSKECAQLTAGQQHLPTEHTAIRHNCRLSSSLKLPVTFLSRTRVLLFPLTASGFKTRLGFAPTVKHYIKNVMVASCINNICSPVTGLEWPRGFQEVKVPRFHRKVASSSLTHRPHLPPGNPPGTHFC